MKNNFNRFLTFSWGSLAGTLCLLGTAQPVKALTFVLDFNDPDQADTNTYFGVGVETFDVTTYGFDQSDFDNVATEILTKVESHYSAIPLSGESSLNFEIGDIGTAPTKWNFSAF